MTHTPACPGRPTAPTPTVTRRGVSRDKRRGAIRAVVDLHLVELILSTRLPLTVRDARHWIAGISLVAAPLIVTITAVIVTVVTPLVADASRSSSTVVIVLIVVELYLVIGQILTAILGHRRSRLRHSPHEGLLRSVDAHAGASLLVVWLPPMLPLLGSLTLIAITTTMLSTDTHLALRAVAVLIPLVGAGLITVIGLCSGPATHPTRRRRSGGGSAPVLMLAALALGLIGGVLSASVLRSGAPSGTPPEPSTLPRATTALLTSEHILQAAAPTALLVLGALGILAAALVPVLLTRLSRAGYPLADGAPAPLRATHLLTILIRLSTRALRLSGAWRTLLGCAVLLSAALGFRFCDAVIAAINTTPPPTRAASDGSPLIPPLLTAVGDRLHDPVPLIGDTPLLPEGLAAPHNGLLDPSFSGMQLATVLVVLLGHAAGLNTSDALQRYIGPRAVRWPLRLHWERGGQAPVIALTTLAVGTGGPLAAGILLALSAGVLGVPGIGALWAAVAASAAACLADAIAPHTTHSDNTSSSDAVAVLITVGASLPVVAALIFGGPHAFTLATVLCLILIGGALLCQIRSLLSLGSPSAQSARDTGALPS
ncbi:MAG: hypothetical protein ACTJHU_09135 [Mycetocola sp.]